MWGSVLKRSEQATRPVPSCSAAMQVDRTCARLARTHKRKRALPQGGTVHSTRTRASGRCASETRGRAVVAVAGGACGRLHLTKTVPPRTDHRDTRRCSLHIHSTGANKSMAGSRAHESCCGDRKKAGVHWVCARAKWLQRPTPTISGAHCVGTTTERAVGVMARQHWQPTRGLSRQRRSQDGAERLSTPPSPVGAAVQRPEAAAPHPPQLTSWLRGSTSGEGGWRTRWSWVIWGVRRHGGKRPSRGVESHRLQPPLASASPLDHAHNVAPRLESTAWACHWHWGAGCKGCEANAV